MTLQEKRQAPEKPKKDPLVEFSIGAGPDDASHDPYWNRLEFYRGPNQTWMARITDYQGRSLTPGHVFRLFRDDAIDLIAALNEILDQDL